MTASRTRNHTALGGLLLLAVAAALGACASNTKREHLSTGDAARRAYEEAIIDYQANDCTQAIARFREVRREFPFTRFAALSDLKAADCQFEQGNYAAAIQAYREFVRQHPSHIDVPYARFQIALSNYEQIPSDWLLAPPSYERDQTATENALAAIQQYISKHPDDSMVPRAERMADRAIGLLARRELYVAEFYWGRDEHEAAAGRLQTLLRGYPGSGLEAQALHMLGEIYLDIEQRDKARAAFRELVQRYPSTSYAAEARDELGAMGG